MGRVGESRIGLEQLICRLPGSREQLNIVSQVGDGKLGQTMLALTEEVCRIVKEKTGYTLEREIRVVG